MINMKNNWGLAAFLMPFSMIIMLAFFIYFGRAVCWSVSRGGDHLELILKLGASPNQKFETGYSPLYYALTTNNRSAVELLIKYGASVNFDRSVATQSLVACATVFLTPEMVDLLLQGGGKCKFYSDGWRYQNIDFVCCLK
jgi:Ankyrin repeat